MAIMDDDGVVVGGELCINDTEIDIATTGKQGGDHGNQYTGGKHDNIMVATQGTSATYALRKLRNDAPEIHAGN